MNKDNRSVNERLDAIEDKLTFKPEEKVMYKDVLLKETGLSPVEYFKDGKATYFNHFEKADYIKYGVLSAVFSIFLIVVLCLNAFVYKQETNLLTLAVLSLPAIQGLTIIATMLIKSIHKTLKKNKKSSINLIIKEDGGCFVKFKESYLIAIINAIFFIGYIVCLCLLTVFTNTLPSHVLFIIFFSGCIGLYLCLTIANVMQIKFQPEKFIFLFEKEDSISKYSNYGGWNYIKK